MGREAEHWLQYDYAASQASERLQGLGWIRRSQWQCQQAEHLYALTLLHSIGHQVSGAGAAGG